MFRLKNALNRFASVPAIIATLGLTFAFMPLTGCEEQGPAEEVGESIDEAGEELGDAIEEATEDLDDG